MLRKSFSFTMSASSFVAKLPQVKFAKKVRTCQSTKVDIDIAYVQYLPQRKREQEQATANPPILLIPGGGAALTSYEPPFVQMLSDRANAPVIVMDNRDVGQSTKLDEPCGQPWLYSLLAPTWCSPYPAYFINDFALDSWALVDAVVGKNSLVSLAGTSMGGAIIAAMFLNAPRRVLSLSFLFSSTFGPRLPGPSLATKWSLLQGPKSDEFEDRVESKTSFILNVLYPERVLTEEEMKAARPLAEARARMDLQHSLYKGGESRHGVAVLHSPDREPALRELQEEVRGKGGALPGMLIVSGEQDRILPAASHFPRLCDVFPTAEKVLFRDGGHYLEHRLFDEVSAKIAAMHLRVLKLQSRSESR